jgi:hypothetical protein
MRKRRRRVGPSLLGLTVAAMVAIPAPAAEQQERRRDREETRGVIVQGFRDFSAKAHVVFAPSLELELRNAYEEGLARLMPEDFNDKGRAQLLIDHYSRPEGVEEIVREWAETTTQAHWTAIFSIDMVLYLKVFFGSKDPDVQPMFGENMMNKYATVLVNIEPSDKEAELYLDGRFVARAGDASKGIRVASETKYQIEVRVRGATICKESIRLGRQEQKMVLCRVSDQKPKAR